MIIFIAIAALLILIALWFVLPPMLQKTEISNAEERRTTNVLVYQDQHHELEADLRNGLISEEQYRQDKEELERRLLEDVGAASGSTTSSRKQNATARVAYSVATAIPVAAVALYFVVGNPKSLSPQTASPSTRATVSQQGEMTQSQIAANVAKLAKKLEDNPNDPQGWAMLARSYSEMQNYKEAAAAYEKATTLTTNDANLWADYAYALAMARGRLMEGEPTDLVNKALQIDPKNEKALILAGSAAFEAKKYDQAIDYWQRVLQAGASDAEIKQTVTDRIDEAKRLAKETAKK
jgi:cytochrome c-type biogenesis protein CcmH